MTLRLIRGLLVFTAVLFICYLAWFWAWSSLVPPDFGMPEHEEEIEFVFMAGSVVFIVVPILISTWVCGRLNRIFPDSSQSSEDLNA
jgi:hypothetical protein